MRRRCKPACVGSGRKAAWYVADPSLRVRAARESMAAAVTDIAKTFAAEYKKTPAKVKLIDAYLVCNVLTGLLQYLYLLLVGSFPFNSFLAGFLTCVGSFVTTLCLRMQVDPSNAGDVKFGVERAFADYVLANIVLFLVAINYLG
eukprot:jgi/Tetstr1/428311/TSEL_018347.t1